jgi:hypothetical protein
VKRVKRDQEDEDDSEEEMEEEREATEPQSTRQAYGAWSNTRSHARMIRVQSMIARQASAYLSSTLLGVIDTGYEEHVVTKTEDLSVVDEMYSRSNPSTTNMTTANGEEMKVTEKVPPTIRWTRSMLLMD